MISDVDCGIGGPSIPVLDEEKSIEQFLTLKEQMEVALLMSDDAGMRCAGIGVIDECSPRGVWCGFLVPPQLLYCGDYNKSEHRMRRSNCILRRGIHFNPRRCDQSQGLMEQVQSRPTEPLCPSYDAVVKEERIGGPPIYIHPDMEDQSGSDSDINTTAPAVDHGG